MGTLLAYRALFTYRALVAGSTLDTLDTLLALLTLRPYGANTRVVSHPDAVKVLADENLAGVVGNELVPWMGSNLGVRGLDATPHSSV